MKELLFECKSDALIKCDVGPLTHFVVDHIMVTYCLHAPLRPHHLVWLVTDATKRLRKPNAYETLHDKVHFIDFLKLFVNYFILL